MTGSAENSPKAPVKSRTSSAGLWEGRRSLSETFSSPKESGILLKQANLCYRTKRPDRSTAPR
nr:MAG TPA: hypothetical protein [Caudoviricetes sp.]